MKFKARGDIGYLRMILIESSILVGLFSAMKRLFVKELLLVRWRFSFDFYNGVIFLSDCSFVLLIFFIIVYI
jgi:hypothetical protein